MPAYVTPAEVQESLYLTIKDQNNNIVKEFTSTTKPTLNTINRLINYASAQVDKRTGFSWQPNNEITEILNSYVDFYNTGIILKPTKKPINTIRSIYRRIYNNEDWELLETNAYSFDLETSEINLTPRFPDADYKVTYTYGFNAPNDLVKNIVIKRITVEFYNSGYLTDGSDPNKKSQLIDRLEKEMKRDLQSLMRMYSI